MTRSKFSTKAILLVAGIGFSAVAFAGSQPAAAQSYTCSGGLADNPAVSCSDPAWGGVRDIAHGFYHGPGRDMGTVGVDRGFSAAHYWGGGFGHAGGFEGFHGGGGFGDGGHR